MCRGYVSNSLTLSHDISKFRVLESKWGTRVLINLIIFGFILRNGDNHFIRDIWFRGGFFYASKILWKFLFGLLCNR